MIVRFVEADERYEVFQIDDWPTTVQFPAVGHHLNWGGKHWRVLSYEWEFTPRDGQWEPYWVNVFIRPYGGSLTPPKPKSPLAFR